MLQKLITLQVAILLIFAFLGVPTAAAATDMSCDPATDYPQFSSLFHVPEASYDIYVRLSNHEKKSVNFDLFSGNDSSDCRQLGRVKASSTSWQKIGSDLKFLDEDATFLYAKVPNENQLGTLPPQIVFINSDLGCSPEKCRTDYNDQQYTIVPQTVSYLYDNLKVSLIEQFSGVDVENVNYFVDGKLLYKSDNTSLDKWRLLPGQHTVVSRVKFTNGQALILNQSLKIDINPIQIIAPYYLKLLPILKPVGLFVALLLGYYAVLLLLRSISRKRRWKQAHFNNPESPIIPIDLKTKYKLAENRLELEQAKKYLLPAVMVSLVGLGVFYVLTTWVIAVFRVDGVSMETTLHNNSHHLIFKLPDTYARITRSQYIPSRYDVVIFEKTDTSNIQGIDLSETTHVVKRVIGLPGERVVIDGGYILVYPKDSTNPIEADLQQPWSTVLSPSYGTKIDITLKDDELFVAGDNRVDSIDSRIYGPIKIDELRGKALFRQPSDRAVYQPEL
ncbi:signal peptidase I [Candidatus Nomurabacteria bacterium]|nr:signal peptidase I [Candidatus Nomurabacteria bacterium]